MTTPSTLARSFPTLKYLAAPFRWVLATRRRRRTAALVVLAMAALPFVWWQTQLLGLPDIGDRFLPGPARSPEVPDDRNAMVLYRLAHERYRSSGQRIEGPLDMYAPWSKTPEALRREVEINGESLDLYRQAADRPECGPAPDGMPLRSSMLHWLVLLEASRREEQGEMAGAWVWYRALLRTIHHQIEFASYNVRSLAQDSHARIRVRLEKWASDPRTTPELLRRALDDAKAFGAIPPASDAYTIAVECRPSEDIEGWMSPTKWWVPLGLPGMYFTPEQQQSIYNAWRVWHRESERSRRIIRLAIANWLAYERTPPARRPMADLGVTGPYDFYEFDENAPPEARALSAVQLDRWLATSPEARQFLDRWRAQWLRGRTNLLAQRTFDALHDRERENNLAVLDVLESELDRRKQGAGPPSETPIGRKP